METAQKKVRWDIVGPELLEALQEWVRLNVKYVNTVPIIDAKNKTERAAIEKAINAITKATSK